MTPIPILQRVVEEWHGCFALVREIVRVSEPRGDGSLWEGAVVVFTLTGHPTAEIAYAWSDPGLEPGRLQLHATLHEGSIDSPRAAVRRVLRGGQALAEQAS